MSETCANCGDKIGNLETPFIWKERVVCGSCHHKLSEMHAPLAYATPTTPKAPVIGNEIICPNPNCGFRGEGIKKSKGDIAVLILLLFIGVLPGLIYAIIYQGSIIACPKCGVKVRDV